MRRFKTNCIQITGKGRLLFNYGQECTEGQLNNIETLLKDGAIIEIEPAKTVLEPFGDTEKLIEVLPIPIKKPNKKRK